MSNPIEPSRTAAVSQDQPASAAGGTDETAPAALRAGDSAVPHFGPPAGAGEVGTLGPYRVLKQLGAGGMGAVYLALDTRLDRKLAFKVMLPEFAADRSAKERFLREARAAAKISHDNVVTVFEADERDGVPYIAMQYLQGYPLDEYLKTKGAPALPHVLRIARETALGLAAAHALGLVHRDIKPANLWLEAPNGRVKVLDFGLAKPIGSDADLTKSGAVVGTPAYMSPEQARGQKVDHRTDLFSLGAVLYRLCTGKTPFAGPNVMAVLMALGTEDPTPVRELNPNVPDALAQLIHQLLAKKADDRPQTATEVAKRLRAILEQLAAPPAAESSVPMATAADISTSMPVVVHALPMQPPIVVPMQITAQQESAFANLDADDATHIEPTFDDEGKPKPKSKSAPKKASGKGLLIAAGVAVLLAAGALAAVVALKGKTNEPEAKAPDAPAPGDKGKPGPKVTPQPPKTDATLMPPKAWVPPAAVAVGASPFDKLDPKEIPAADRFDWQPKELVAVAGTHSPRTWARMADGANLAVSPDGSLVATGGQHSPLRVWDVKTRTAKVDLPGYLGYAVTFGADGKAVYSPYSGGYWDLTQPPGPPTAWKDGPPPVGPNGLWLAPDNSVAVGNSQGELSVWDATAKPAKLLSKFPLTTSPFQAAVTPDVKRMAHFSGAEKKVLIHDISRTEVKERWRLDAAPASLALSADGTRLVTAQAGANRRLWNLTAEPPTSVVFGEPQDNSPGLGQMAFRPDGKRLVTQNLDGALHLWDVTDTPKEVWAKPFPVFGLGNANWPTRLGFAGEGGNTLVVFTGLGLVHFIDVSGAEPKWLNPIEPTEPAGGGIAFDGATGRVSLARAADQRFQWWDFGKPKPAPVDAVAPAGTVASTADGGKQTVWDAKTNTLSLVAGGKPVGPLPGMLIGGTFTADGRTYWEVVGGGGVKSWDVSGATPREVASFAPPTGDGCARVSLHRNDTVLACNWGNKLTFWDLTAAEPRLLSTFPGPTDARVYVFPDGERVLTFDNVTPQLWQATTKGWVKVWEDAAAAHWHALGGVWTAPDGTLRYSKAVVAHPSGQWLALYGKDEITIRRTSDGGVVWKCPLKAPPWDMEFAPDGRHLFVANGFNTVYVLRLPDLAAAAADNRAAAEWALSVGGKVRLDKVSNPALSDVKSLPAAPFILSGIDIPNCGDRVSDADLARLEGLPELIDLHLRNAKVTDAGVVILAHCKRLNNLTLESPGVTDVGLAHLTGSDALVQLDLKGTKVTAAGVAKLAKALPKCKIAWDGGTIEPKP